MNYDFLADLVVLVHLLFVVFALLGGLLVLRWLPLVFLHVPCMLWAATVEFLGLVCPLTPLEISLRQRAGQAGYEGGFVEEYLVPILYPGSLTPAIQIVLGFVVLAVNAWVYVLVIRKYRWGQSFSRSSSSASRDKDEEISTG